MSLKNFLSSVFKFVTLNKPYEFAKPAQVDSSLLLGETEASGMASLPQASAGLTGLNLNS